MTIRDFKNLAHSAVLSDHCRRVLRITTRNTAAETGTEAKMDRSIFFFFKFLDWEKIISVV